MGGILAVMSSAISPVALNLSSELSLSRNKATLLLLKPCVVRSLFFFNNGCIAECSLSKPYSAFLITFRFQSRKFGLFKMIFSNILQREFSRLSGL
jgi:hypothetical protein